MVSGKPFLNLDSEARNLAFAEYKNDCAVTLRAIFEKPDESHNFDKWLAFIAEDEEAKEDVMHDQPVHLVAKFLGMDRGSDEFMTINRRYHEMFRTPLSS